MAVKSAVMPSAVYLLPAAAKSMQKNAAKTKVLEITEAPPAADEARRFRGSVPIGGHEVAGNRLTRRCISFARPYRLGCCGACHTFEEFCKVSGSGAGRQTILNFDTVLPTPHLPTGRKSRSLGFLRIFGDFLCAQKVTRRRPNRPISPPVPRQNKHPRG